VLDVLRGLRQPPTRRSGGRWHRGFAGNAQIKTECLSEPRTVIVAEDFPAWAFARFERIGNGDILAGATQAMVQLAHERDLPLY
jgi:hypothetical protein